MCVCAHTCVCVCIYVCTGPLGTNYVDTYYLREILSQTKFGKRKINTGMVSGS